MEARKSYKYYTYFVTVFITFYLCQQILWSRFVAVGPGYITGGTFIYFSSPVIIDVVAEVYGYRAARQLLWCGLFALLFLGGAVAVLFALPYPPFWQHTINAYQICMGQIPRIAVISAITIFIGQIVNAYAISKWKILTRGKYFWVRSLSCSLLGDSLVVVLSNSAILFGNVPLKLITLNLIPELIIMVSFTLIASFPACFLARLVAKSEGLNNYDIGINFNPFKMSLDN